MLIGLAFLAPNIVAAPVLGYNATAFYPGPWDYFSEFLLSLPNSLSIVQLWANRSGGMLAVLFLAILGMVSIPRGERENAIGLGVVILLVLLMGLLYVVPFYGAVSFQRIWISAAIFLTGAMARGLYCVVIFIWRELQDILATKIPKKPRAEQHIFLPSQMGANLVALLFLTFLLGGFLNNYFGLHLDEYENTLHFKEILGNISVDPNQTKLLLEKPDSGTTIIYMEEISFYYYLSNGGLDFGAIYYPAIRDTPEEDFWFSQRRAEISYLVNDTPIQGGGISNKGSLELLPRQNLIIRNDESMDLSKMQILVGPSENQITLNINLERGETQEVIQLKIAPGPARWVGLINEAEGATRVAIRLVGGAPQIKINGIRLEEQTTYWPWNKGISLIIRTALGEETVVQFSHSSLAQGLPLDLEVLNDSGFTILARVVH